MLFNVVRGFSFPPLDYHCLSYGRSFMAIAITIHCWLPLPPQMPPLSLSFISASFCHSQSAYLCHMLACLLLLTARLDAAARFPHCFGRKIKPKKKKKLLNDLLFLRNTIYLFVLPPLRFAFPFSHPLFSCSFLSGFFPFDDSHMCVCVFLPLCLPQA